jgi:hypothetical protein
MRARRSPLRIRSLPDALLNYIIPPVMAECSPVAGGVTQNNCTSLAVQSLLELHPSGVQYPLEHTWPPNVVGTVAPPLLHS